MDESLRSLGTIGCRAGTVVFFEDIGVSSLMSSTLAEMQAIVLALECISLASSVCLFLDSQSVLDACKISWHKVKGHSGILENDHANSLAGDVSIFEWFLLPHLDEHFLVADGVIVSGNSRHFEIGSGLKFLLHDLFSEIDWHWSLLVWHPDLHMVTGYTSKALANVHTYFMKALYCQLPVAVCKCLYNKCYLSILCLYCGKMKISDHVFSCKIDELTWHQILESHVNSWKSLLGLSHFFSDVLQLLLTCISDYFLSMTLFKGCVFEGWFCETVFIFHDPKVVCCEVVEFTYMEKNGLILFDDLDFILISGLASEFSAGMVKMLGIAEAFGIRFGFCKFCLFFSGISDLVSVHIAA
ncbi:hypothetical protein G9A89_011362 [Geosiphon pyriformis]|nr:hypothetical protein G9A89_011362 [Geosiphon pyriformis]